MLSFSSLESVFQSRSSVSSSSTSNLILEGSCIPFSLSRVFIKSSCSPDVSTFLLPGSGSFPFEGGS